jgi:hypothetical protein
MENVEYWPLEIAIKIQNRGQKSRWRQLLLQKIDWNAISVTFNNFFAKCSPKSLMGKTRFWKWENIFALFTHIFTQKLD